MSNPFEIPLGDEQEPEDEPEHLFRFVMTTSGVNEQQAGDRLEEDISNIVKRGESIILYGSLELIN